MGDIHAMESQICVQKMCTSSAVQMPAGRSPPRGNSRRMAKLPGCILPPEAPTPLAQPDRADTQRSRRRCWPRGTTEEGDSAGNHRPDPIEPDRPRATDSAGDQRYPDYGVPKGSRTPVTAVKGRIYVFYAFNINILHFLVISLYQLPHGV